MLGVLDKDAKRLVRPVFEASVSAGFPSPADDFMEAALDLNEHLIANPPATFFVRVAGDSMQDGGIYPGDILIVDKSLVARSGQVVIAQVNGDFLVKRLKQIAGRTLLVAENAKYEPLDVTNNPDFSVWGVVTNCIHRL